MDYYVIWPDGQRFGPADAEILSRWAQEGRIEPGTELEEAEGGKRLRAADLPGLEFTLAPIQAGPGERIQTDVEEPPAYTGYGIPEEQPLTAGGPYPLGPRDRAAKSDVNTAWGLIVGGLAGTFVIGCCCSYLTILSLVPTGMGIHYAAKAKRRDEAGASTAFLVGIVVLCVQVLMVLAWAAVLFFGFFNAFRGF